MLLAGWLPLQPRCSMDNAHCFEELKAWTDKCKTVRTSSADTRRGQVTYQWQRCPAQGFRGVKSADYVTISDEKGGLWGFTNLADPTAAQVSDVGFIGKRLVLVQASRRAAARASGALDLAPDKPQCLIPEIANLDAKVNELLQPGESLRGKDWELREVTSSRVVATRPVFTSDGSAPAGQLKLTLSVGSDHRFCAS